ncbi:Metallopeptidase toxin 2 [Chitinophaga sp. CF418]|nr:Metallopeptidase toxin 2 [Chitinophaga sp. CF418]
MQGRVRVGGKCVGGYRYGFNGQEKSEEINGEGNGYTAMFWEYDPRIGRRWNIDPVIKPWQGDYVTFSNDPINKVDPLGVDDYFNSKGQLINSTKTKTSHIYVQTSEGNVLLTQLSLKSVENRQAVANIVGHYAKEVGIDFQRKGGQNLETGKGIVGLKDRGDMGKNAGSDGVLAFT